MSFEVNLGFLLIDIDNKTSKINVEFDNYYLNTCNSTAKQSMFHDTFVEIKNNCLHNTTIKTIWKLYLLSTFEPHITPSPFILYNV